MNTMVTLEVGHRTFANVPGDLAHGFVAFAGGFDPIEKEPGEKQGQNGCDRSHPPDVGDDAHAGDGGGVFNPFGPCVDGRLKYFVH
jgi:hypothetical protein